MRRRSPAAPGTQPRRATAFLALGDARFVSLTTFRRSGEPVSTPLVREAYPAESRVVLGIERLAERLRGQPATRRLALRITPS